MSLELQIVCVMFFLMTCVAGTWLIYHDGATGNLQRLGFDCRVLAGMIIVLTFWAGTIGYNLQTLYNDTIEEKDRVIENLSAEKRGKEIEYPVALTIRTSGGNVATFGELENAGLSGFDRSIGGSDRQSRSLPGGDRRDHAVQAIPGGWFDRDRGFSLLPSVSVRGPTGDDGIRTLARESF